MKFGCVIPARYGSTRLPGKPLADIAGKPMIERVYDRVSQATKRHVLLLLLMMTAFILQFNNLGELL